MWFKTAVEVADKYSVVLFYASAYGNTSSLAQAVSRGVTKAGVGVEIVDLETATLEDVSKAMKRSKGFMVGRLGAKVGMVSSHCTGPVFQV